MLASAFGVIALSFCFALPSFSSSSRAISEPKRSIDSGNVSQFYGNYWVGYSPSLNLYDKDHVLDNYVLSINGSITSSNQNTACSALIPVKPQRRYTGNYRSDWTGYYATVAFYDEYQHFLGYNRTSQFDTPADCAYLRLCTYYGDDNAYYGDPSGVMLFEGSVIPDTYQAYSCQYIVRTPYAPASEVTINCFFNEQLMSMVGYNHFSDSNMDVYFGYIEYHFDGNYSLMNTFIDDYEGAVHDGNWLTFFNNVSFEPNAEDDYEVGLPVDDIRLLAFAHYRSTDSHNAFNPSYSHCSQLSGPIPSGYSSINAFTSLGYPENPYCILLEADPGYYFPRDFVVGGNVSVIDKWKKDEWAFPAGFAKSVYISFDVPFNGDSSIVVSATPLPTYAVSQELSHCSVEFTPNSNRVYEGEGLYYELVCSDGYAFNSNNVSIFLNGASNVGIIYYDKIYGDLYSKATITGFAGTSSVTLRATGLLYTQDYNSGFDDGKDEGEKSGIELKQGLMDLIPNVFASIGAFFFTFSGVNFMGINLLAVVGIVVSVGLIGVVIKVALK